MEKGFLPTTSTRRNSLQSRNEYVSLSIYEGMARDFGRMAFPGREIEVHAVTLNVRRLVPDLDQLRNVRHWKGLEVKDTLAYSLTLGHGAQVKGRIEPCFIQPISILQQTDSVPDTEPDDPEHQVLSKNF